MPIAFHTDEGLTNAFYCVLPCPEVYNGSIDL